MYCTPLHRRHGALGPSLADRSGLDRRHESALALTKDYCRAARSPHGLALRQSLQEGRGRPAASQGGPGRSTPFDDKGCSPRMLALGIGQVDVARVLVTVGADFRLKTPDDKKLADRCCKSSGALLRCTSCTVLYCIACRRVCMYCTVCIVWYCSLAGLAVLSSHREREALEPVETDTASAPKKRTLRPLPLRR